MPKLTVALTILLAFFLQKNYALEECSCGNYSYFNILAKKVTEMPNGYNLQKAFFPPETANPIYVTVNYVFIYDVDYNQTWHWSENTYYASFHPRHVYQYTSLFFGEFAFKTKDLKLEVEVDDLDEMSCYLCTDFMQLFTQRVSF